MVAVKDNVRASEGTCMCNVQGCESDAERWWGGGGGGGGGEHRSIYYAGVDLRGGGGSTTPKHS